MISRLRASTAEVGHKLSGPRCCFLVVFSYIVTGNDIRGPRMSDDVRTRASGRPRKYRTSADRLRAFRAAHGLRKVTLDVPDALASHMRAYARKLREESRGPRRSAEPNATTITLRWRRRAGGFFIDHPPISAGIREEIIGPGVVRWAWKLKIHAPTYYGVSEFDDGSPHAQGRANTIAQAKYLVEMIIQGYCVDIQYERNSIRLPRLPGLAAAAAVSG